MESKQGLEGEGKLKLCRGLPKTISVVRAQETLVKRLMFTLSRLDLIYRQDLLAKLLEELETKPA